MEEGMCKAPREEGEGGRRGSTGRGGGVVVDMNENDGLGIALTGLRTLRTSVEAPGMSLEDRELFHAIMDEDDSNAPSW
jgi:hypothetical protein